MNEALKVVLIILKRIKLANTLNRFVVCHHIGEKCEDHFFKRSCEINKLLWNLVDLQPIIMKYIILGAVAQMVERSLSM